MKELWIPSLNTNITKLFDQVNNLSYLVKAIRLLQEFNFQLEIKWHPPILGGHTPIRQYTPTLTEKDIKSLRKKRIMFMDQLCSLDGQYLLTWKEIQQQMNVKFKGPIPQWFLLYRTTSYTQ